MTNCLLGSKSTDKTSSLAGILSSLTLQLSSFNKSKSSAPSTKTYPPIFLCKTLLSSILQSALSSKESASHSKAPGNSLNKSDTRLSVLSRRLRLMTLSINQNLPSNLENSPHTCPSSSYRLLWARMLRFLIDTVSGK